MFTDLKGLRLTRRGYAVLFGTAVLIGITSDPWVNLLPWNR